MLTQGFSLIELLISYHLNYFESNTSNDFVRSLRSRDRYDLCNFSSSHMVSHLLPRCCITTNFTKYFWKICRACNLPATCTFRVFRVLSTISSSDFIRVYHMSNKKMSIAMMISNHQNSNYAMMISHHENSNYAMHLIGFERDSAGIGVVSYVSWLVQLLCHR